eukprot:TRINITY_DN1499_c0_g1_i4.p2 TRINITY_DN1499_c0_g1~~TRINITY_DN1499_c0_g1_i4.p2  ORF type:complete len:304 (+),score=78.30 TRINITY_DN1499_c0_g1_i4:1783-2694(+)
MDLVVLQHGSHGEYADFRTVVEELKKSGHKIETWGTDSCKGFGTDKGVEAVAATIAAELDEYLLPLLEEMTVRVCFVGHSMGGLIIRAMLTKIKCLGHKNLVPLLYMSVATPHLGIRQIGGVKLTFAYLLGKVYSQAYADLCQDNETLSLLCDASHIEALKRFQVRTTMVNIHDHLVSFGTAAMLTRECCHEFEHEDACKKLRKPILLTPSSVPSDDTIRDSYKRIADFGNLRANRVVKQFKALRSLEWELVAVDLAHRGNAAHADIIARPGRGDKTRNVEVGRFSASRVAQRILECLNHPQH